MAKKPFLMADLFCGAGGTSTGAMLAAQAAGRKLHITAVNHWERAVETHAVNHPRAAHFCQDLSRLRPLEAVPGGKLDLLVASPECIHHSNARGGKPKNDQSRASAWIVLEWLTALQVREFLIENVAEMQTWGPLDENGHPIKDQKGVIFHSFVNALAGCGYNLEYAVLNSANYGAATARKRLFIRGVKGKGKIKWPKWTHHQDPSSPEGRGLARWRGAREIIDWSLLGSSIFTRDRPLSPNTLARIEAGLIKFGGKDAEPFLFAMNYLKSREHDGRYTYNLDRPLPTITSQGNRFGFITSLCQTGSNGDRLRSLDSPLNTITTVQEHALVHPFIARVSNSGDNGCRVKSVEEPLGAIHAGGGSFGVVDPYMVSLRGTDKGSLKRTAKRLDEPVDTITAGGGHTGIVEPFLTVVNHGEGTSRRTKSVKDPLPTVTGSRGTALVQPFILAHRKFNLTEADDINNPVRTLDATNCRQTALVTPHQGDTSVDILFRMLQPAELKLAMGFPADYKITGNKGEQTKQIGNAVEVNQALALISQSVSL